MDNLHLVIIEKTRHDAEALADTLRSAGYEVHFGLINDLGALEAALEAGRPDLVLCGEDPDLPGPDAVLSVLREHSPETPLVAVAHNSQSTATMCSGISSGASIACLAQPGHLQLTVGKELETLRLKRKLSELTTVLQVSENCCRDLMEGSQYAIATIRDGNHVFANHPYLNLFGFKNPGAIMGKSLADLITPEERNKLNAFMNGTNTRGSNIGTLHINGLREDGKRFDAVMEFSPVISDGEPCTQVIIHTNDIDAGIKQQLETLTKQDNLTGLSNRQHFMEILEETAKGNNASEDEEAVIYLLLDNFKSVREDIGITASDQLLCDVARLIKTYSGAKDSVARFGDHAFALLHHTVNEKDVQSLAEKIRRDIENHKLDIKGRTITTTVSIGICLINEHTPSAQNIMSRADLACEVAHSSGGNQIHTHSTAVDEQMGHDDDQQSDEIVRKTIEDERLYLVYQPIVSLNGMSGQRYEVLLRIVDDRDQAVLPGQFISIAEKSGLVGEIDRWVINNALKAMSDILREGKDATFFIKLSASTLADRELPRWINEKLNQYAVKSDRIVFEIPERVAILDLTHTMMFSKAMQKLRCKVALQHYDASSQAKLLQHLPLDYIKINGNLISNLASSEENQLKVKSIAKLAHTMGKLCVAEYVEDAVIVPMLFKFGIDFIQGYFVQEPSKNLEYAFEGEIA